MNEDISCEEVKKKLDKGQKFNFIDVREIWEYEEMNIGAKCIPLNDLPSRLDEIDDLKKKEIIIHCRSGARSGKAKRYLNSQGFENVRNMIGGIIAYQEL